MSQSMPTAAWRDVLRRDPCAYCTQPSIVVDHIHPVHAQRHVDDSPTNLIGACRHCNSSKGGKSLLSFLSGHAVGHPRYRYDFRATPYVRPAASPVNTNARRYEDAYKELMFRRAYKRRWGRPDPDSDKPLTWRYDETHAA